MIEKCVLSLSRRILLWCSEKRWLGEQAARRRFTKKSVRRFLPGEDVTAALAAAEAFREHKITTVVHELGENVSDERQALEAVEHYRRCLDLIREADLDTHISLKPSHIGLEFGTEQAYRNLQPLLEHAERLDNFVWIDMEGSATTDRTLELFRRARSVTTNVGICLQTYLYRTEQDLEALLPLAPAIRLVKGAYDEPATIAYPRRRDVDGNFFLLAQRLLHKQAREAGARLAVATHDQQLIRRIVSHAESAGYPAGTFEIQMLYGIKRAAQIRLAEQGLPVRVLVSYGENWYPWFVRRLAERPANIWFLLRNLF